MEYRVYIDQDVFAEWPAATIETRNGPKTIKVDIVDAAIVKVVWQYQQEQYAPNLRRDDDGFVFLGQAYLASQLPLLGLSERGMRERLRRLCEVHFLLDRKHHRMQVENGIRLRTYYHTSQEFDSLFRWFGELHNKASNGDETSYHRTKRPDIEGMIQERIERHKNARPAVPRDEKTGKFSTSEGQNSNSSNGTTMPFAAAQPCRSLRHDDAVDSPSYDSRSRDEGSSPNGMRLVENRDEDFFKQRKKMLDEQAELLRLEAEEEGSEGEPYK